MEFSELFKNATGYDPYPYQKRIARDGFPDVIEIPTGMGKTAAAVLPWLYRRRFHRETAARDATPRRLVVGLPARVLVEQTRDNVRGWLSELGLSDDVDVVTLMGGEPVWLDGEYWAGRPEADVIVVGTIDMVLSRCLMRGYGSSRGMWPIDFAVLNNDTQFIFDEVQLFGPALSTARQLQAFRELEGTYSRTRSTYMSATLHLDRFVTPDAAPVSTSVQLEPDDLEDAAVARLFEAPKALAELVVDDPKKVEASIAQHVIDRHRRGTLSLSICNTVARATNVYKAILKLKPDAEVYLLHSRFRPPDRAELVEQATAEIAETGPGRIIVSTQVVEAGVDIDAAVLTTEVAPWSSLVQRAGRCNRRGRIGDAEWWWVDLPDRASAPYEPADLAASGQALRYRDGEVMTSQILGSVEVDELGQIHPILRRRELFELFDTSPDLSGNDVEVSSYIREDRDDADLAVAWRQDVRPGGTPTMPTPTRDERCPVPLAEFRKWWKAIDAAKRDGVVSWDADARSWRRCEPIDVRPGNTIVIDADLGGYTGEIGWSPTSKHPVPTPDQSTPDDGQHHLDANDDTSSDPLSSLEFWVTLPSHLVDAENEAQVLVGDALSPLPPGHATAVVEAAAVHDIGKAHPVFQNAVRQVAAGCAPPVNLPETVLFAKTGVPTVQLKYERRGFRHELVSALWVLAANEANTPGLPPFTDPELVAYLAAAHHGKVRITIADHKPDRDGGANGTMAKGVQAGDQIDELVLEQGVLPSFTVDLAVRNVGAVEGRKSWKEIALGLLERDDLGPFRLAYLETLVRIADMRASAEPTPTDPAVFEREGATS